MLKRTKLLALSLAALMMASQTGYAADGSPDAQDSMPSGFSSGAFSGGFSSQSGLKSQHHEVALPEPTSMAYLAGPVILNICL